MEGETVSICGSWVLEMKNLLDHMDERVEKERWERHCIYRVPEWLKKATDPSAYIPELVSLGPFHNGRPDLLPMEEHKRRAMLHLVNRSNKPLQQFVAAVAKVADQLMDAYKDLSAQESNKHTFVAMMVKDGCFLVELMMWRKKQGNVLDYASSDPVFGKHRFPYIWPSIYHDIILIENQLPLLLIQTILDVVDPSVYQNPGDINWLILGLLNRNKIDDDVNERLGLHPLGILHSSFTYSAPRAMSTDENMSSAMKTCTADWMRDETPSAEWMDDNTSCAVKMREGGIHFKKSRTDSFYDIHYQGGVLSMPCLKFDGHTSMMLLNLMAFERLHAEVPNVTTEYVHFMDDIIDTAKDVELLKSKQIIQHEMGSDKDLARLFNSTLNRSLVMREKSPLQGVRRLVCDHCKTPWNKWRADLIHTYFSNPWVFISLVAAVILLVATLLQTICTVFKCQT